VNPLVSVCIGTYDRPHLLRGLLAALQAQTHPNWEAFVCDESDLADRDSNDEIELSPAWHAVNQVNDPRIKHVDAAPYVGDWHRRSKLRAAAKCNGDYLMFPQDDSYYVPTALAEFVKAATAGDYGLIYCNWLNPQDGHTMWPGNPKVGHIDIGGFMVRRDVFELVPWTDASQIGDGRWVEDMIAVPEVRHGLAGRGVLYVKN
jgi:glycosyltransferase involved in cell wall biosynthesis